MFRIITTVGALLAVVAVLSAGSPAAPEKGPFPDVIQLPTGFRPEGIEVGRGTTFYAGSVANGAIYRGDLRTGTGAILVPGAAGKAATGIELDSRNRLFVAGAATGTATVYNAGTGALVRTYTLGTAPTFINDVVVTPTAAYFTDSQKPVLYRVPIAPTGALGNAQTIDLRGDYAHVDGQFNLNGIDATPSGKTLVAVQSVNGRLYRIDPASGVAKTISLGAGERPERRRHPSHGQHALRRPEPAEPRRRDRARLRPLQWADRRPSHRLRFLGADDDRRLRPVALRRERAFRPAEPGDADVRGRPAP